MDELTDGRIADVHSEAARRARAKDGPSESHRFRQIRKGPYVEAMHVSER